MGLDEIYFSKNATMIAKMLVDAMLFHVGLAEVFEQSVCKAGSHIVIVPITLQESFERNGSKRQGGYATGFSIHILVDGGV